MSNISGGLCALNLGHAGAIDLLLSKITTLVTSAIHRSARAEFDSTKSWVGSSVKLSF